MFLHLLNSYSLFVLSIKNKPYKSKINKTQHALKLKVSEAGHCTEEEEVEQKGIIYIFLINVKVKLAKPACTKRCQSL